jgi:hypothetical protein
LSKNVDWRIVNWKNVTGRTSLVECDWKSVEMKNVDCMTVD